MGKKKKQQNDDPFASLMSALAERAAARMKEPTAEEYAASLERLAQAIQDDENSLTVRRVAATRSLCACPARDEVVVVTPSAKRRMKAERVAKEQGRDPVRSIVVYTVSGHHGSASPAELDIEDAKKLVNALSEAIAETEFITAEAK